MVASTDVYFGGGSFFARQKAMVLLERQAPFERSGISRRDCCAHVVWCGSNCHVTWPSALPDEQISALAGYAGSKDVGPGGLVCYHGGQAHTVYEGLGDAQVVQVTLRESERRDRYVPMNERVELKALLASFFASLRETPGAGYQFRNCIGIPGGMPWGPLYHLIVEANIHNVDLVKGDGDDAYEPNTVRVDRQRAVIRVCDGGREGEREGRREAELDTSVYFIESPTDMAASVHGAGAGVHLRHTTVPLPQGRNLPAIQREPSQSQASAAHGGPHRPHRLY